MVTYRTSLLPILVLVFLSVATFRRSMCSNHRVVRCDENDRKILLIFKQGNKDYWNSLSSWSSEKDCCTWEGIQCDNTTGRVTKIDLFDKFLQVEIPSTMSNLQYLTHLDLHGNGLIGSIPRWLGRQQLQYLDLSYNQLNGSIPYWLGQQKQLQHLDLSLNQLTGSIPNWLGQQKQLQHLDLSYNRLNGSIPDWIGQLEHLQHLDLSHNMFFGSIPSSLGSLSSLVTLSISSNSLTGSVSESIFSKLSKLELLDLSDTNFAFHFDHEWIPPFQLSALYLKSTYQGPNFPPWIYTQKSLITLGISNSGISFIDVDKFRRIVEGTMYLDLSNNSISADISNVTLRANQICLQHNNFTGELPRLSAKILQVVDLSHNSFSGSIIHRLDNWEYLTYINLWSNQLSGEVLMDLSNSTELEILILGKNKFSGTIPNKMPQNIQVVILRSNQFEGNIPHQLFNLASLFHLDLAHNNFSGSIPQHGYNMTIMITDLSSIVFLPTNFDWFTKGQDYEIEVDPKRRTIDLSANNLSGEIPLEIFRLIQVHTLNLSHNHFSGRLHKEIGDMKNLESLDLSNNNLVGEIPQSMAALTFLGYLNLSLNNFNGQIPTAGTQLQSFNASSYIGNRELCGAPLPKCISIDNPPESATQPARYEDGDSGRESLYLGIGVGFAVGFWGSCGSLFFNKRWRHTFFWFLKQVADQIYVTLMVNLNHCCKTQTSTS